MMQRPKINFPSYIFEPITPYAVYGCDGVGAKLKVFQPQVGLSHKSNVTKVMDNIEEL